MTEVEQLIRQAQVVKESYRKTPNKPKFTSRTWQELLDGQPYPLLNVKNL